MDKLGILFYISIVFLSGLAFYIYLNLPASLPLQKPKSLNLFLNYPVERLRERKKLNKYAQNNKKDNLQNFTVNPLKNCRLMGIIYPKFVFISCNKENKVLKVGETLLNCTLKKIEKDKVIFNCSKTLIPIPLEKLKKDNLHESSKTLNKVLDSKDYSSNKDFNRSLNKNIRSISSNSSESIFRVNRKQVIDLISSGKIFYQMAVIPYYKNGKIIGFKVNGVRKNSFVYKMGIRKGDIILSVNDYPIRSMEEGFAAFERLKRASEINIKVLRQGREVTLSYIIED